MSRASRGLGSLHVLGKSCWPLNYVDIKNLSNKNDMEWSPLRADIIHTMETLLPTFHLYFLISTPSSNGKILRSSI